MQKVEVDNSECIANALYIPVQRIKYSVPVGDENWKPLTEYLAILGKHQETVNVAANVSPVNLKEISLLHQKR